MKNILNKFLHIYLYPSCAVFTLILFVFTVIESNITALSQPAITTDKIMIILVFSLLLGLANLILRTKLNKVLKVLLHFLACAADFVLTFIVWAGYASEFSSVFMLSLVFCVIYFLIFIAVAIARSVSKRAKQNSEEYKSML